VFVPPVWIIAIIVLVAIVGIALVVRNSSAKSGAAESSPESKDASSKHHFPQPVVNEFHVKGSVATTVYEVPLGDAPAGDHLVELLSAAAVEYLRGKQRDGFPLDDVATVEVSAMRGTTPELIGTVELPSIGTLPDPMVVGAPISDADPIGSVAEVVADSRVSAPSTGEGSLEPVASFVQITGPIEARLRSIGVDTGMMSLRDLSIGLMQIGGYELQVGRPGFRTGGLAEAEVYRTSRAGRTSTIVILPHTEGDYPEVEERQISELAVAASQVDTDQLILITDKYGPYSMYERERRTDKLVFITRERLQTFVDSFGLS
jgi:hypothetical protein